ncbi:MAG: DUF1569 domain-containing protein [Planctomycetes bacterium]|nr:DUF1569 domain-containing protein [Planctomycetota bacterium]MCH9726101.1 DUF1569 domain-containing protein [Planctomycetota bacterium]MCH9777253.1 DUF1569 domain-containing protein [Planctomycetota bacterium]MCH9791310.1 DUF1569 domain-containing protein [Planctomycetota bacterium]
MSTKTTNRRTLSYASLQEVVEDARRLTEADAPTTGGWTKGQIFEHLARTMDSSLDGFAFTFPWPVRIMDNISSSLASSNTACLPVSN